MEPLIRELKEKKVLRSDRIEKALRAVDRADFVPNDLRNLAYDDTALPIGFGQTISQPYTVVFMLEILAVEEKNIVLDVGFGSGWQTALLAHLVGISGKVFGIEVVKELCGIGKENILRYPDLSRRAVLFCRSAKDGLPQIAKENKGFDRIIAAAEVERVPVAWRDELKSGGVMVYPSRGSIYQEIKTGRGEFKIKEYPGFAFVPFV